MESSKLAARNLKLETRSSEVGPGKNNVVSNHSTVSRSTCEGDGFAFRVSGLGFEVHCLGLEPSIFSLRFGAQRLLGTEDLIP